MGAKSHLIGAMARDLALSRHLTTGHITSLEIAHVICCMSGDPQERQSLLADPTGRTEEHILDRAWDIAEDDTDRLYWDGHVHHRDGTFTIRPILRPDEEADAWEQLALLRAKHG